MHDTAARLGLEVPFASCAEALFVRGWPVIKCFPRSKRPIGAAWRPPHDLAELRAWIREAPAANIGLAAGDGIGWIDWDFDDPEAFAAARSVVSPSPIARRGSVGLAEAFRIPSGLKSFKLMSRVKRGKPLLEVLATSGFVVVPPSLHPDGHHYQWVAADTPMTFRPADLPMLPLTVQEDLRRALAPWLAPTPGPVEAAFRPSGRPLSDHERGRYKRVAAAALASYVRQLSGMAKGGRSYRIYIMARSLAPYAREGILSAAEIQAAAHAAAEANGFLAEEGPAQVARDVQRGLAQGRDAPLRDLDADPHWKRGRA